MDKTTETQELLYIVKYCDLCYNFAIKKGNIGGSRMKWLHLSDIHYNPDIDRRSTLVLREKLLTYLTEKQITAEHLFLTGDYRHAGKQQCEDELLVKEVTKFIIDIANTAKVNPDQIHVIPGNHDLERTSDIARIHTI